MLIPVAHLEWVEWTTNHVLPKYNKTARILPGRFAFKKSPPENRGLSLKSAPSLVPYIEV